MAPPTKYPWGQMIADYVHGETDPETGAVHYPTLDQLARRYGVRADHLRRRSGKERWPDQRKIAQADLEVKRREARTAEYLAAAERIDGRSLVLADEGLGLVHARVQEMAREQEERKALRDAGIVPPRGHNLDAMELTRLALAGIRWHQLAMRSVGQEAERGGLAAPGDATDLTALVITEKERSLAAVVGARVREAIEVQSRTIPTSDPPPEGPQEAPPAPVPSPAAVVDAVLRGRSNGSGVHNGA